MKRSRFSDLVIPVNLSFHKSAKAKATLRARGAWMLFLPQYSPDQNPIKMICPMTPRIFGCCAHQLKAHLRKAAARTFDAVIEAIGDICNLYNPEVCQNHFKAAG